MPAVTTDVKCSLLQTADKKLWLYVRKAKCADSTTLGSKDSNQTEVVDINDEIITYPTLELWRHCLLRGANLGSFATILFGTPVLLYKGVRQPSVFLQRLSRISTYGVVRKYTMYMFWICVLWHYCVCMYKLGCRDVEGCSSLLSQLPCLAAPLKVSLCCYYMYMYMLHLVV